MENPTFSKFCHWLLSLIENSFCNISSVIKLQNLKYLLFQNNSFLKRSSRTVAVLLLFFLSIISGYAQLAVPFTPRLSGGNIKVKGDIVLIGNSIIAGKGFANPYNGTANNNPPTEGVYINIDAATSGIFSSSSADLKINNSCKKIVWAGLYWASIYPNEVGTDSGQNFVGTPRLNDWNQVKFKVPGGNYVD